VQKISILNLSKLPYKRIFSFFIKLESNQSKEIKYKTILKELIFIIFFYKIWLDQHHCSERESNIKEPLDSPDSNQTFTEDVWLPAGEDQEVIDSMTQVSTTE
jgi:hypothetical protein